MPISRKPANFMPNTGQHRYIINKKTLQNLQDYQKNIVEGRANPGERLLAEINHFLSAGQNEYEPNKPLTAQDLQRIRGLKPADFMQLIMNTRVPTIFAESQAQIGEGAMWNNAEYEILGNIASVITNVKAYDNGKYQTPDTGNGKYVNSPEDITLMCIPGAILKPPHTIDRDKILTKQADGTVKIDEEKYKQFYKNRLQMILQDANDQSKKNGKNAFITLPGIGNGAFGGEFQGQTIPYLSNTLKELLKENPQWKNIGCVWIDGYSSPICEDEQIGNTKLRVRNTRSPGTNDNLNKNRQLINGQPFNSLGQLSKAQEFAESNIEREEFAKCQRFKILAWDHFSFEGNDWVNGARQTDEANMASCDALGVINGTLKGPGETSSYRKSDPNNPKSQSAYYPPAGYPTWNHYYHQNNIKQSISDRLFVCDDNGQFLQVENNQKEKELLSQQSQVIGSKFGVTNVVLRSSNYQPGNNEYNAQQPLASIQFEFNDHAQMQAFSAIIPKNQIVGSGVGFQGQLYVQVHPDFIKALNQASVQQKKAPEPVATFKTVQAHATPPQPNVVPAPNNFGTPTPSVPHVTNIPGGITKNKASELLQKFGEHLQDAIEQMNSTKSYLRSDSELIPELILCLKSVASGKPYTPANTTGMSGLKMDTVTAEQGILTLLPEIQTLLEKKQKEPIKNPAEQARLTALQALFTNFEDQLGTPEKAPLADNLAPHITNIPGGLTKNRALELLQEFRPHLLDAQKNIFKQVDGGLRSDIEVIPELIQCLESLAYGKPYSPTNQMSMSRLNMGNVTAEQGILELLPMITKALEVKEKMTANFPKLQTPVATFKTQFANFQKQLQTPEKAPLADNLVVNATPKAPLMIEKRQQLVDLLWAHGNGDWKSYRLHEFGLSTNNKTPSLTFDHKYRVILPKNPDEPIIFLEKQGDKYTQIKAEQHAKIIDEILGDPIIQKLQNLMVNPQPPTPTQFVPANPHVAKNNTQFVPPHPPIQKYIPHGSPAKIWPAQPSQAQPIPVKLTPQQTNLLTKIESHIKELKGRDRSPTEITKLKALELLHKDVKENRYENYNKFLTSHIEIKKEEKDKIKAGIFSHKTENLFDEADNVPRPK